MNAKRILSLMMVLIFAMGMVSMPAAAAFSTDCYFWDFEDTELGTLPDGFTVQKVDTGNDHPNISMPIRGNTAAVYIHSSYGRGVGMTSWFDPEGQPANRYLITPKITVPEGDVYLAWLGASIDPSFRDSYEVRLSTTGNLPGDFTTILETVAAENPSLTYHSISLKEYAGQEVYIAFRLTSYDQYILVLDNIYVGPKVNFIRSTVTGSGSITPWNVFVQDGESVEFSYQPYPGYRFVSVAVDGVLQDAENSYTFTNVTSNHSIEIIYELMTHTIAATAGPGGTISPAGKQEVAYNGSKEYTFTPHPGYGILDVTVDGVSQGKIESYTFENVQGDHTISVEFEPVSYTVTATAGEGGTINPVGENTVNHGSNAIYTITPDSGYRIASVLVDGVEKKDQVVENKLTLMNITGNQTIAVTFEPDEYTITATAGAGGTISPSGEKTVAAGEDVTYTITPDSGFKVLSVLVDGAEKVSELVANSYTFTNVTANHTIQVNFAPNPPVPPVTPGTDTQTSRRMSDSSGITLSGSSISTKAGLNVRKLVEEDVPAALKSAVAGGQILLGYDISLTGSYYGPLTISFPVGQAYEGKLVTILHYVNGTVETYTPVVKDGFATITVNSLSPFVVLKDAALDLPATGGAPTFAYLGIGILLMMLGGAFFAKRKAEAK